MFWITMRWIRESMAMTWMVMEMMKLDVLASVNKAMARWMHFY